MDCCICNKEIDVQLFQNGHSWFHGYNAQPIKEGRCCSECNIEVERQRYVAYDVGLITYDGKKIPADALECKRQAKMSEGEVEYGDEIDAGICSDEMKNAVIDGDAKAIKEAWLKAQQDSWESEGGMDNGN